MGTLRLPPTGDLYVDANTLIYSVQQHPRYAPVLAPLWQAQENGYRIISSQLTRMETLVLPLRLQDTILVQDYRRLFASQIITLVPITADILDDAARLRSLHSTLKTPDAIHAATALHHSCTLFITNDHSFMRIPELPHILLDDLLNMP
jgi:predicted nucleic acid-binding protein